jgi:hypothetical protein
VRNSNGRLRANSGREPREKVTILRKKFSPPNGGEENADR